VQPEEGREARAPEVSMSRFIVRVELHGAPEPAYELLHELMGNAGFARTIWGSGKEYHLPSATYCAETSDAATTVRQVAKQAADATGYSNGVIVTEGSSTWVGLKAV
jgi:hypothetical protein